MFFNYVSFMMFVAYVNTMNKTSFHIVKNFNGYKPRCNIANKHITLTENPSNRKIYSSVNPPLLFAI